VEGCLASLRWLIKTFYLHLKEPVNSVLVDSRSYHTGERNQALEQKIKMTLQGVAENVYALRNIARSAEEIGSAMRSIRELRMAVTGRHFEDEHTGPLDETNEDLESIALAGLNAKRALLTLQHSQYRWNFL
jgi:hypothetical protein